MGLQSDLGYVIPAPSRFNRIVTWLSATRIGAWLTYHFLPTIDRIAHSLSGGRGTVTKWFAGVPAIWVKTTGARSGKTRSTPLFGIPIEDDLALIGTGVGQGPTPDWVHNLLSEPTAYVEFRGRTIRVTAREATSSEEEHVWGKGADIYPGFLEYRKRLERRVRIFVLEPA